MGTLSEDGWTADDGTFYPRVFRYKGVLIEDMPREDLIEAVKTLGRLYANSLKMAASNHEFWADAFKLHRSGEIATVAVKNFLPGRVNYEDYPGYKP